MRKRSPAEKLKREKQWREHLAKKNSPIRGKMALPDDCVPTEIDWKPDFAERGFTRLREMDEKFAASEKEYRKHRIAVLEQMRDADLKRLRELA